MIIEGLTVAALLAKSCYDLDKSQQLDAKAAQKYSRAFAKEQEARMLIQRKAEYTDMRLANVANKKRSIVKYTVPKFVDVYSKIQKIEIENKSNSNEITFLSRYAIGNIDSMAVCAKKDLNDKELICGWVFQGVSSLWVKDSERNLSAANSQMRASNVAYSQAQSIGEVYDAIVARADRIANLLTAINVLFIKSINETDRVIQKNGLNIKNYSEYDKGVLMACVNVASAAADIVNIPVVDANGKIAESAVEMIQTGEQYIQKMNDLLIL